MTDPKGTANATPVSPESVRAFRLRRHHLDRPAGRASLARAVGDACGIQAQVMAAAQLGVRVRVRNATVADVETAMWDRRSLARVWCMRGTVHLVPAAELATFVRGCTRLYESRTGWLVRAGLSEHADRLVEAASEAMDRPRTRPEIAERVAESLGIRPERRGSRGWGGSQDAAGFRVGKWVLTVPHLAFLGSYLGLAVFGPDEGDGSTFVRPDAWLPEWRDMPAEAAEDALLRRYLRTFGPATVRDFQAWAQMPLRGARAIWSRLADAVRAVAVDGETAWILREDLATLRRAKLRGPTVRLLPYFDSFLMGHKGRDHLIDRRHYKRIYRAAGWVYPAVLVDGRIAGDWSYERTARALRVRIEPYIRLGTEVRALVQEEADDVARFLGAPEARVAFGKVR